MQVDRRYPIRPFDVGLIVKFLGALSVENYSLISTGRCNTNYLFDLSNGGRYVLRLYSRGSPEKDQYYLSFARQIVPVADMLGSGEGWAIFEYVPGEILEHSLEDLAEAAKVLANISSISFERAGELMPTGDIRPFPFAGVEGFIQHCCEQSEVIRYLGNSKIQRIKTLLTQQNLRIKRLNGASQLVHGDFNPSNVLIYEGKVSAILDWEYCHAGSPYMDIANLLRNTPEYLREVVKQGLIEGGFTLDDDWVELSMLIDLTSHLEFLSSSRSEVFKQSRLTLIDTCLSTLL